MNHRLILVAVSPVLLVTAAATAQQGRFEGSIEVGRILTEVRVITAAGEPILGLETGDFAVTVGGIPVEVEAVEWVAGPDQQSVVAEPVHEPALAIRTSEAPSRRSGRTVVILVQTDFARVRLVGLFRMSFYAQELVRGLSPDDRVALFVFGSHLQLHSDLTNDFDGLCRRLTVPALLQPQQTQVSLSSPSLIDHYNVDSARDAADIEQGLEVVAETLEPLPGPKSIVLLGWGLGRYGSTGVRLSSAYGRARIILARARTTVFSLDVTDADYHTLEVGLQAVAADTGGFYAKTHLFPGLAISKLAQTISGYYELSLVKPKELEGYSEVEVEVADQKATVLVRPVVYLGEAQG